MACGKIVLALAISAVFAFMAQEASAGDIGLGQSCVTRSSCDATQCPRPEEICCKGLSFAMAGKKPAQPGFDPEPTVAAVNHGRCSCCGSQNCVAGFGSATGSTTNTQSSSDTYVQTCSRTKGFFFEL